MKLSPLERILLGLTAAFVLGAALIFCFGNRSASVIVMTEPSSSGAVLAASTQGEGDQSGEKLEESGLPTNSVSAEPSILEETAEPNAAATTKTESPDTASSEPATAFPAPESTEAGQADEPKINLNTATAEQLETLPGIGEKRAEAILTYREKHGPFSKIEDVVKVSGIGQGIFSKIKPYLTVE